MSITVPAILKYLSDSNNNMLKDEDMRSTSRAKKRRLDHLSWEEKVQRKKLKNRVAAQTSRDRKKAKMEEMEHAIQELFYKNEELMKECKELRNINRKLNEENTELRINKPCCKCNQSHVECEVQQGSAAGSERTLGSFENTNHHGTLEDCIGLPSLPDLLNELDRDVDIDSLEELTQSLLQDIAADLEAAAQKTNCEESNASGEECKQPVVGSSPEQLEPSRCDGVKTEPHIEQEISPYLLLHHNYSARHDSKPQTQHKKLRKTKLNTKTKPKLIMPKVECDNNSEVLYGTLDETTNCITIIVDNNSLHLSEAVTEVVTTDTEEIVLSNAPVKQEHIKQENEYSPYSSSDCGYESLDSPHSVEQPDLDMWDQSVSELFPMLL